MTLATVLITSGGGFQGLALMKALRAAGGQRVLVADCHLENVTRYFADAFFHAPLLEPPQPFLDFALTLCEREKVSAVFAASDHELALLAAHRQAFARQGATVFVPDHALLELAGDKLALYRWLSEQGLSCLPFFSSPSDPGTSFPLLGKPRHGWGGQGVLPAATPEAAAAVLSAIDPEGYVWQPQLTAFEEYSVDFAVNRHGQVSPLAFRRRVRLLGGFAILSEPGAPAPVCHLAHEVVQRLPALGALGPMNLQILRSDEDCWVSDLNPRIGTSMPLSLAAGHNPVTFLLDGGANCPSGGPEAPAGARALRYLEERYVPALGLEEIGGVVFDLDDTLLDQKTWILAKLEITWTQARNILPPRGEFLTRALRILEEGNRAHLFDALCQELCLDEAVRSQLIQIYRAAVPEEGPLYADVHACMDQLRRLDYRLGLVTDNPTTSQRLKVEVCGLESCFDALLYTSELGTSKPDPRAFAAASEALGLPAGRLVMVGDNLFRDLHGALEAGYGHAFHIQRPGSFFNFNPALARRAGAPGTAITPLSGLHELLWHLHGARS